MPIQNVNAANNAYQVAGADTKQNQKINQLDNQDAMSNMQGGDKLEISTEAEKLRSADRTADNQAEQLPVETPAQAPAQDTNPVSEGFEAAAVPKEKPIQEVRDKGVVDNRNEQLTQRQQSQEAAATERSSRDRNPSLDLTV